jgi:hypothetical protein
MVFINDEKKLLFLHIPKCGGCYIRTILLNNYNYNDFFAGTIHHKLTEFCDKIDNNVNDKHTITIKGKYRYFTSHQNYDEKKYKDYYKYTFVRNPYDKLHSAYYYLKENIKDDTIRGLYENMELFVDFKTFINNISRINNISYFHAFITQYNQLINEDGIIDMNYIGNVETLDEDFLQILNINNIDIKHQNVLFKNEKINTANRENIFDDYDEEMLKFVNEYFKTDFLYFNYIQYNNINDFKTNHGTSTGIKTNNSLKIYKMINIIEYNIELLEKLCKDYETIKPDDKYKLEFLNDDKNALFFQAFKNIKQLKQLTEDSIRTK